VVLVRKSRPMTYAALGVIGFLAVLSTVDGAYGVGIVTELGSWGSSVSRWYRTGRRTVIHALCDGGNGQAVPEVCWRCAGGVAAFSESVRIRPPVAGTCRS